MMSIRQSILGLSLTLALTLGMQAASRAADAPSAAPAATFNGAEYRLGSGDKLRVVVYGEDDISGEYGISATGEVSFPLIGAVQAEGQTVTQLRDQIEAKLKDGYLRDPNVSVEVLTYRPFFILGEVNKPGEYEFTADLTVPKAVATAGGYTYRANTRRIFIKHVGQDKEEPYPADSTTSVAPGDVVRVSERYF